MRVYPIAFAFAGAAAPLSAQPIQTTQERPSIIVGGYGEVKTMPDIATVSYTLRGEGQTSDDAVRAMVAMGNRIETSLRSVDAAAEPHSDKVKVTPIKPGDCKESSDSDEGSPQLSTGSCAIVGYVATQDVIVRTADVKDAGTMVGLAGRGGAYDAEIGGFDLRDPKSSQGQAIADAVANARSKAEAIAAGAHLNLGPIINVSTTAQEAQAVVVTGIRRNAPAPVMAPPPVAVNLTPEPITTSANVTVTYAIGG
jgi:uncharacterized protein YggE